MVDVSTGQDALKIRYAKGLPKILLDDPELAPFYSDLVHKEIGAVGKAFGSKFHIVLKIGDPETVNTSLADAVTKAEATTEGGQSRYKEMQISPTKRFAAVSVSGSAWRRSMSDMQSFIKHNTEELDSGLRATHRALSNTIAGSGYGVRATVESVTTTTVTITAKADMFKLRVGQDITCADQPNATARTGTGRITAVQRDTRTVTVTGVDPSGSSWQAGDFLFQKGDFSTTTLTNWLGVGFWIPTTIPAASADSSGIDRSSGPELHGHRFDCSAEEDIIDALQAAAADFHDAGMPGQGVAIYLNPIEYGKASKILQLAKRGNLDSSVQKGKVAANVGYSQFILACALGNLPVISDRTFPVGAAHFLKRESFYVVYDGKEVVAPIDEDGQVFRVASNGGDGFTAKIVSESQLVCEAPGHNGVAHSLP